MGRCNNRRTQQRAETLKNTPARARFSNPPPHLRNKGRGRGAGRGGGGGGRGENNNKSEGGGRGQQKNNRHNKSSAAVVAKITQRVQHQGKAASTSSSRPLQGIDKSKLEQVTLSEESMQLITQLLRDLDIVKNNSSSLLDDDGNNNNNKPSASAASKLEEETAAVGAANNVLSTTTSDLLSATAREWTPAAAADGGGGPVIITAATAAASKKQTSVIVTITAAYEEYEDDGEDDDCLMIEEAYVVAGVVDETVWDNGQPQELDDDSDNDDDDDNDDNNSDMEQLVVLLLRNNDPVFLHLTQRLSFRNDQAAKACRAVENWSALHNTNDMSETTTKNKTNSSSSSHATRLGHVMDWLCLHLTEDELKAGFQTNRKHQAEHQPNNNTLLLAGTGKTINIKPIPHPSISIAKPLTQDVEWRRQTQLEERAIFFLEFGFGHKEIVKALQQQSIIITDIDDPPKGTCSSSVNHQNANAAAAAAAAAAGNNNVAMTLRTLLTALEQEHISTLPAAAAAEAVVVDAEELETEREMEREALAAIYDTEFQVLELDNDNGHDRYQISLTLDGLAGAPTQLVVFLRPHYPASATPLFLVSNPNLPWPFLRQMNCELIDQVSELGVGAPIIFEIASYVSEHLYEKLQAYYRLEKAKEFEKAQLRLRQAAGHELDDDDLDLDDDDAKLGRRQRARLKMAHRAFDADEKQQAKEAERQRRQAQRLENIAHQDKFVRQNMADRAIAQREMEQHQQALKQVSRTAMSMAFGRGETTEQARRAAQEAEAAYRRDHGLEQAGEQETTTTTTTTTVVDDKNVGNHQKNHQSISAGQDGSTPPGGSAAAAAAPAVDNAASSSSSGDDEQDIVEDDGEAGIIKATPTTAAFMERLRSMYASAAQAKQQQVTLSEPAALIRQGHDTAEQQEATTEDAQQPTPVCPLKDAEVKDMMDDIVELQQEQPWLVSEEARVPTNTSEPRQAAEKTPVVPLRQNDINERLKREFERKNRLPGKNGRPKKLSKKQALIQEQRERLPAFSMREEIVNTINDNQITLVKGSTGCGKTTQVPQLVLEDLIAKGRGSEANIIVTQPRRISAMGVAERIASELGENVGQTCGYSIKLEKKCSRNTRILLCTTGILLRRLQIDPDLASVSHVFVDETHERDLLTDFLLIICKQLAERRKSLKLVLMSATVSSETFKNYFDGCAEVDIPGRAFPVQEYRLEDILQLTGYEVQEGSDYAVKASAKNNAGRLSKSALKKLYYPKYDSKVIHSLSIVDENVINYEMLSDLLEHIILTTEEEGGAILVFMPGMGEITKAIDEMRRKEVFQRDSVVIYPLHSTLSTSEQTKVFDIPPPGVRKIVVSTNIAETSITIEDVVFVVDSGRVKENRRDEVKETPTLVDCWVSRASAKQRRGRSGRVRPGVAYHMYSSHTYEKDLLEYTLPEMLRVGVEDLTLQILILDLGEPHKFLGRAVDPPSGLAMKNALSLLEELGAVECKWHKPAGDVENCSDLEVSVELTALGFHLATLPVEPRIGKIMIYGAILGCVDDALTIAASMSSKNFFASSFDNRDAADAARKELSMDDSDHLTVLAVFNEWQEMRSRQGNRKAQEFMRDNFLNRSALFQMEELRKQYSKLLVDIGFLPKSFKLTKHKDIRAADSSLIKAILCAGLYPNIIVAPKSLLSADSKQQLSEVAFQSRRRGDVYLHPSTLSSSATTLSSRYLCFHEIVKTSKMYIRDATAVTPFSLLLFGGALVVYHEEGITTIDHWLKFRISRKPATLVKYLRSQMEGMLLRKIVAPDEVDDGSQASEALIKAVRTLLESEKYGSSRAQQEQPVLVRNDGAEIVRPWLGPEHEVESSRAGRSSQAGRGRGGGRGGGRGRGRGRLRGRGRGRS